MIKSIKKIVWNSLNFLGVGGAVQLTLESDLKEAGWFESYHQKKSIDKKGNPLPWFTYPFIKFIEPRLKREFDVYEYGSGNSTRWFSAKVNTIVSVENDQNWYSMIKNAVPENATLYLRLVEDGSKYEDQILEESKSFDIVVIDGRKREKCTINSIKKLKSGGIIIFDNSERPEYNTIMEVLKKEGFKRIDFWGIGPIIHHTTCTTVFYKDNNCLGI